VKQPVVSVIIPTYNRVSSLEIALEAISTSNYPINHLDVIVVNDGSDYSVDTNACDRFKFPLRFVQQANSGATVARNNGAKVSSEKFFFFWTMILTWFPDAIQILWKLSRPKIMLLQSVNYALLLR
jgi:glycosyltransferase involved in cell wall biosynthesis